MPNARIASINSATAVAVDAMDHDKGPKPIVLGALDAVNNGVTRVILIGDKAELIPIIDRHSNNTQRRMIDLCHTDEQFKIHRDDPDDNPMKALRRSPKAPVKLAAEIVAAGNAVGAMSTGDTGASVVAARKAFGKIAHGVRPVISAIVPGTVHPTIITDVGAHPDPTADPEHFADRMVMAEELYRMQLDIAPHRELGVGLLNIGREPYKGHEHRIRVYRWMREHIPNFTGNIEACDIFTNEMGGKFGEKKSTSHIVVADADQANVFLKTSKGLIAFAKGELTKQANRHRWAKIGALVGGVANWRTIQKLKSKLGYDQYGGAPILGVDKPFIIGHGSSKPEAITEAILQAGLFNMPKFQDNAAQRIEEIRERTS